MFSVIICSRKHSISDELFKNIKETIDGEYELIILDNSENNYTIFTAYNEGVKRAHGDILCFMHDDILFRTQGWGKIIDSLFEQDASLGLIGFAGAHFLPDFPLYWDESPFVSEYDLTTRSAKTEKCFKLDHFNKNHIVEVAVVDGMCFFVKKVLFGQISFDESTYGGFHLYDMDISMQVRSAGYKVCVCRDVLVEHFYEFNPNKPGFALFETNLKLFFDKWSSFFPLVVGLDGVSDGIIVQMNSYVRNTVQMNMLYKHTVQSKAYRLGKALLLPFKKRKGK